MKKLREYLIGIFGAAVIVPFYIIQIFSIPLSVLAIIHLAHCTWWMALIYLVILYAIPFVNILMIFAPLLGLYFLVAAHGNFEKAAYPNRKIEILKYEDMTDEKFQEFKNTKFKNQLTEGCKQAAAQNGFEGKITSQQSLYCDCVGEKVSSKITKEDYIKSTTDKNYEPLDAEQRNLIIKECQQ